jgi:hypothetical protein
MRPRAEMQRLFFSFQTADAAESARAWIRGLGARPIATSLGRHAGTAVLRIDVGGLADQRGPALAVIGRVVAEHEGTELTPPVDGLRGEAAMTPRLPETSLLGRLAAELLGTANEL